MATQAEELERMVIRLVGDSSLYVKELKKAEEASKQFQQTVQSMSSGGSVQDVWAKQDAERRQQTMQNAVNFAKKNREFEERQALAQQMLDKEADKNNAKRYQLQKQYQQAADNEARTAGREGAKTAADALTQRVEAERRVADAANKSAQKVSDLQANYARKANDQAEAERKSGAEAAAKGLANRVNDERKTAQARLDLMNNSAKVANQQANQKDKEATTNRQKLLDERLARQRLLDKKIQDQEKQQADIRRNTLFETAKQRQRLLDEEVKNRQARFEASNKLALQTDLQREKQRIDAQKDADDKKKKADDATKKRNADNAQSSAALGDSITKAIKGTAVVGGAISGGIGYIAEASLDAYSKFNLALTESTSIMGATAKQEKAVEKAALDMSMKSKFSATEMAEAFYHLSSAGLNAQQSIAALPVVSNFATAGAVNLQKATDLLMTAQGALAMRSEDAQQNMENLTRITDVLTLASKKSVGSVTDFAFALTRESGAAARAFGKDIEEVTALLMAFHQQGVKGEVAGSYTARLTRFIADRSVENQQIFKQLGLTGDKAIFDEQTGKMRNYADIIQDLGEAFKGMSDQGRTATLHMMGFEPRMQSAVMAVLGMNKQIRENEKMLRGAGGTAEGIAAKQMEAYANQLKLTSNQINVVAIKIGEMLAPAMLLGAKAVSYFLDLWMQLPDTLKSSVVWTTVFFAVVAAGFTAAVGAVIAFNFLFGGVPILILAAIAALTAMVGLLVGLGVAIYKQAGGWEYFKGKAEEAWEWLKPVREAVTNFFKSVYRVGSDLIGKLSAYIIEKVQGWFGNIDWSEFRAKLVNAIEFAQYMVENLGKTWEYVWATIKYYSVKSLNYVLENFVTIFVTGIFQLFSLMASNWDKTNEDMEKNSYETLHRLAGYFTKYSQIVAFAMQGNVIMATRLWYDLRDDLRDAHIELDFSGVKIGGLKDLENRLNKEMQEAKKNLMKGFNEWKKPGGVGIEKLDMLPFPDVEIVKEEGEKRGKDYVKGLDNGVKLAQASLIGSAEALSRILAYRDVAAEPDETFKIHGGKKVEAIGAGTGAAQTFREQLEALKGIRDNTGELLKRDPVEVKPANLGP